MKKDKKKKPTLYYYFPFETGSHLGHISFEFTFLAKNDLEHLVHRLKSLSVQLL